MRKPSSFHGMACWLTLAIILPALFMLPGQGDSQARDVDREIKLLAGGFTPARGLDPPTGDRLEAQAAEARDQGLDRIHALVQLDSIPTEAEKADLAARGLELQAYVPNNAWIAAISATDPTRVADLPGVRWVGEWSARDKLHPRIREGSWGPWAKHQTDDRVMVVVQLHADVPLERGAGLVKKYRGIPLPPVVGLQGLTAWIPPDNLLALAGEEEVMWIEEGPAPLSPTNDGVRQSLQVDPLYSVPYSLDGSGVRIFVFDGGTVRSSHDTFDPGARVTVFDSASMADHPTHVAGTAAGDGDGGRAQGVAPAATVLSSGYQQYSGTMLFWDNAGDIEADYTTARNTYQADLGTNSIGSNTASNNYNCDREGDYGVSSSMIDSIVRGDNASVGSPVLMVWANGNERTGGSPRGRCGSNYHTTAPPSCAKNPIHIGAINSDYDSMTSFSSWGPCDDGRLKPVVSASGCELGRATGESYIYSSLATNNHAWGGSGWCGTSMSTPAAAGVVALLTQDWRLQGYGGANDRPLPALIKAMLIHTARDLGQDGPDYIYGYGEVDAQAAVDLLRGGNPLGGAGPHNWGSGSISQGGADSYSLSVPAGTDQLKVSLAWDDSAAAAYSAVALVNDLDLQVVAPDDTVYYPWVLDAGTPWQQAATGVNTLDNQEQVIVSNPQAGSWTVQVLGNSVPDGPQSYGLVYSVHSPTYDPGGCTEQIDDGGFESAGTWTLSGAARVTSPRYNGSYALRLGGVASTGHTAYQQVVVPAGSTRAELSFYWHMTTNESSTPYGHTWDFFYAEVRDTSDAVLATFDYRSDGWQQEQWLRAENIDLMPWVGQTVRMVFYATNDSLYTTSFYVDDVSLEACSSPTAVDLVGFQAIPTAAGIRLEWETANELNILGFHLYRRLAPDGERLRLSDDPIPAAAPGSPVGASYTWLDEEVVPGTAYVYTLESIDFHGRADFAAEASTIAPFVQYLPLITRP